MRILHYVTQWLWLSDSFVHGPIAHSRHDTTVVSRGEVMNLHVYPHPRVVSLTDTDGCAPEEGAPTAASVRSRVAGTPDVVHLHHGYGIKDAVAIAAAYEVPLVVSFWGFDATALPATRPGVYDGVFAAIDRVLVPSQFLASVVSGLGARTVTVMPGGTDTAFFASAPMPSEPRVAFVGRFVEKKGIDVLLSAWHAVVEAVPSAELVLLGYGDDMPRADGVRVLTPDADNPRAQVRELLRWCRVYVSPSRTAAVGDAESQHIGNLEAQATGRPVVTTRHGGIPEFVRGGETALLVEEGDPEALAAALIGLLGDVEACRRMGAAARQWALRFDVRLRAGLLDDLYETLATTRTGR